jgi:nicotinate-nucleotide adenylyltransferase
MWSSSTIPSDNPPPRPSPARGEGVADRPSPARGEGGAHPTIGILGGTFDPVHNGHLAAARQLRDVADLSQVWLMPNARPPHRMEAPAAGAEDRMRMVELATAGQPGLAPSRIEVDRGGISYTIDTIRQLVRQLPGQRFAILLGSDAALKIRSWRDADALLDEASFVIFNRPETTLAPQTLHELGFAPARSRIVHLDTPPIAAHQVRDRLARGIAIDDLVPAVVADYIRSHALYAG